jgi:hypothetical protein
MRPWWASCCGRGSIRHDGHLRPQCATWGREFEPGQQVPCPYSPARAFVFRALPARWPFMVPHVQSLTSRAVPAMRRDGGGSNFSCPFCPFVPLVFKLNHISLCKGTKPLVRTCPRGHQARGRGDVLGDLVVDELSSASFSASSASRIGNTDTGSSPLSCRRLISALRPSGSGTRFRLLALAGSRGLARYPRERPWKDPSRDPRPPPDSPGPRTRSRREMARRSRAGVLPCLV